MNLISKKMIMAVMLVATVGAQAVGHWTVLPYSAAVMPNGALSDCDVDSKGTIWYTLIKGGLFSQSPDTTKGPVGYAGVPAKVNALRMGIYVDRSTDSVFVGSVAGEVYAGQNGVFKALPSIPLKYSFYNGLDSVPKTNVGGLIKDTKGHLVAATDSMAWWFDGAQWNPIGTVSQYPFAKYGGTTDRVFVHPNGKTWVTTAGEIIEISPDLQILDTISERGSSVLSFGPDGSAWGGSFDCLWLYVRRPPNFTLDSIALVPASSGLCNSEAGAAYADQNGWVWASMGGTQMELFHGDTIKYHMTTPMIDLTMKFLLAPDSTFWMCSAKDGLYKYSEKYAIPPEAINGSAVKASVGASVPFDAAMNGNLLRLRATQGIWRVRIADMRGAVIWNGKVSAESNVPMGVGSWIVQAQGPQGQTYRKLIAVIR